MHYTTARYRVLDLPVVVANKFIYCLADPKLALGACYQLLVVTNNLNSARLFGLVGMTTSYGNAMIPLCGNATSRVNTMSRLIAMPHFVSWKYTFSREIWALTCKILCATTRVKMKL